MCKCSNDKEKISYSLSKKLFLSQWDFLLLQYLEWPKEKRKSMRCHIASLLSSSYNPSLSATVSQVLPAVLGDL